MKIEKVINNNVVSALENGREVVVMGRGIGFQLRAGMDIPGELIEKVFRLDNPGVMDQFKSLVQKLPPERLQISAEVSTLPAPAMERVTITPVADRNITGIAANSSKSSISNANTITPADATKFRVNRCTLICAVSTTRTE